MKISEAINIAGGNLARPTKFTATVVPPLAISAFYDSKSFDALCKTATIPETNAEPIEMVFKGHTIKYPGRVNQQLDLTLTFYLDEYHQLRKILYDWLNSTDKRFYGDKNITSLAAYEAAYDEGYHPSAIKGSILLSARDFGETSNHPIDYVFHDVYPTSISGVEFNGSGTSEVLEVTATFAFSKFTHIDKNPDLFSHIDNKFDSWGE